MKLLGISLQFAATFMASRFDGVMSEVVLSEKVMKLSLDSATLSSEAYSPQPNVPDFHSVQNFINEPDQAIIARKNGYCFLAFRGTTQTWDDWRQNFRIGTDDVCGKKSQTCCAVRSGFYDAYFEPNYVSDLEKQVDECVSSCTNINECLVITGHSQGGAVAAVAGVLFSSYNPYVITFGEPPSIEPDCKAISSHRWYRYVNTKESELGDIGISYDPVPFVPGLGTIVYGHFIILGADKKRVAYIGLDSTSSFSPLNVAGVESHSMVGSDQYPGYKDRISTLISNAKSYPIPSQGFAATNYCTEDDECETKNCSKEKMFSYSECVGLQCTEDNQCDTNRCDSGSCVPKLGSCMTCDEDSDCASGRCLLFKCANSNGLMDDECRCKWSSDCESGRCEGFTPPICEAKLPNGEYCDENEDCLSGKCSWLFKCKGTSGWFRRTEQVRILGVKSTVFFFMTPGLVVGVLSLTLASIYVATNHRRNGYKRLDNAEISITV